MVGRPRRCPRGDRRPRGFHREPMLSAGMPEFCLVGVGRMGQVHAANIMAHPKARLRWVVDLNVDAARELAERSGARFSGNLGDALADPELDVVLVASSTATHVDCVRAAARAGKAIFCEKPLAVDSGRYEEAAREVEEAGVPLFVAFNRRFDPSFRRVKAELATGSIGKLELLTISSRDPAPPPEDYLPESGGLFRDMMIHDLDMASWLVGDPIREVYTAASALVSPQIARSGHVDTAVVTLKTAGGILCQITNSRRATYGYDQRLEAFGSEGMLQVDNPRPDWVVRWDQNGGHLPRLLDFFMDRYREAYEAELDHFIRAILDPKQPLLVGLADGRKALRLADAVSASLERGEPIYLMD